MDGGRRKLKSLDGPLRAVGGAGTPGSGPVRALYSSRPLRANTLRAEPVAYRAPQRSSAWNEPAARPRRAAPPSIFMRSGLGWLGVVMLFVTTGVYGASVGERWQELASVAGAVPNAFARGSGFTIADVE